MKVGRGWYFLIEFYLNYMKDVDFCCILKFLVKLIIFFVFGKKNILVCWKKYRVWELKLYWKKMINKKEMGVNFYICIDV